jgi:Glycosyl transferases group 1
LDAAASRRTEPAARDGFAAAAALFDAISTDLDGYQRHHASLATLDALATTYADLPPDARDAALAALTSHEPASFFGRIALQSFASELTADPRFMRALATSPDFDAVAAPCQYFLLWQVLARGFLRPGSVDGETATALQRIYRMLVRRYTRELGLEFPLLPSDQRDWNTVVLVTQQFLAPHLHAPTADVLDYAARLQHAGKRVLLLNAALLPRTMAAPFYKPLLGQYFEAYERLRAIPFEGGEIAFHQCTPIMPDPDEIHRVVRMIHAARPGYVLSMGHSNLVADMCGTFTTTVGFPFSTEFQISAATTYVLPRRWRDGDDASATSMGLVRERILASDYRFRLPARGPALQRGALGFSDDAILLAVVGNRLENDATPAWLDAVDGLLARNPDLRLVFAGTFTSHEAHCRSRPHLAAQSRALGFVADVPALLDAVDLYLNPPRHGGGSSAAYALACGVPVATDTAGDVANVAGDTVLPGIATLDPVLVRWRTDPAWRAQLRQAARARWGEISDRDGLLQSIDALARLHGAHIAPVFSTED